MIDWIGWKERTMKTLKIEQIGTYTAQYHLENEHFSIDNNEWGQENYCMLFNLEQTIALRDMLNELFPSDMAFDFDNEKQS